MKVNKLEFKDIDSLNKIINLDDIHYKVIDVQGKLFKFKKKELIYIEKKNILKLMNDFIDKLSKAFCLDIKRSIKYEDECYYIILDSNNNSMLIGKDGKMINSIQLLIHQIINCQTEFNIRINVDVANYKENKKSHLETEIKSIAKEIISSKIEVKLDPMNSYDRRIVHTVISKFNELETESFGENPNRYVVIRYKEDI